MRNMMICSLWVCVCVVVEAEPPSGAVDAAQVSLCEVTYYVDITEIPDATSQDSETNTLTHSHTQTLWSEVDH